MHLPKSKLDLAALIEQLQKSPELANTLANLIAGSKSRQKMFLASARFSFESN